MSVGRKVPLTYTVKIYKRDEVGQSYLQTISVGFRHLRGSIIKDK
jgi:hypothetical protein